MWSVDDETSMCFKTADSTVWAEHMGATELISVRDFAQTLCKQNGTKNRERESGL